MTERAMVLLETTLILLEIIFVLTYIAPKLGPQAGEPRLTRIRSRPVAMKIFSSSKR
jgi:hypothetical protein